jgi:NADH-quinone oxidoreductase subunit M
VKVPLIPLHSWLPLTYTQAPAPVTALLSGVLAKLGTYGLLRLVVPALIEPTSGMNVASTLAHPTITVAVALLAVVGILVAALIAWMQSDFKTLVAYSSISHLGFCVLALLALNTMGLQAALLYMVNHGISTAGLFLILGMIERRVGTREMGLVSGLGRERPWLAFFLVLFVMSSIGLPLTNGFVSEFLSVMSAITADHLGWGMMILAAAGILFGAIYMLHMTAGLLFGPERIPMTAGQDSGQASDQGSGSAAKDEAASLARVPDLRFGEILGLAPLAVLVIVLGVRPGVILDHSKPELELATKPVVLVEASASSTHEASNEASVGTSIQIGSSIDAKAKSADTRSGDSLVRLESSVGRVVP